MQLCVVCATLEIVLALRASKRRVCEICRFSSEFYVHCAFDIQNPCSPDLLISFLTHERLHPKHKVTTLCFCIVTGFSTSFQITWLPTLTTWSSLLGHSITLRRSKEKIAGREIGLSVYIEQC